MRIREQIEKVGDIVKNPVIRVEFQPDTHQDYLDLQNICTSHKLNMTIFARHVLMIWKRKYSSVAEKDFKDTMLSEVVRSMHGITQLDIFSKYETWGNTAVPVEKVSKKEAAKLLKNPKSIFAFPGYKKKAAKKSKKAVKK